MNNKTPSKNTYCANDNTIINLTELRTDISPSNKYNIWHPENIPIPYFEKHEFGMETHYIEKEGKGIDSWDYINTIPSDLQVYVIEAEAGDFWKVNCNEQRPESLKEWKHGYSKGFATSEEENILVFWAMIW